MICDSLLEILRAGELPVPLYGQRNPFEKLQLIGATATTELVTEGRDIGIGEDRRLHGNCCGSGLEHRVAAKELSFVPFPYRHSMESNFSLWRVVDEN